MSRLNSGHLRVIGTAARQPLPVAVLAATAFMAFAVHWIVLPLGLIAYLATVWTRAGELELEPQRVARELPEITSPAFQSRLWAIDRARQEVSQSIGLASGTVRELLEPITLQADELYEHAVILAGKGQTIEQYLSTFDEKRLDNELSDLDQRISGITDQYTLDQLQETSHALTERRDNARDLATHHERITAQLRNIDANLQNVLSETVRLRTAETADASTGSEDAARHLRNLNARMDAYQQVLEGAISQTEVP